MSHVSFYTVLYLLAALPAYSQKKWDGGGGNNSWINPLNWVGNTVPTSSDEVVFDNSIISSNYSVVLPSVAVVVRRVTITPAAGKVIDLTLPAANTASPGFTASGPGYGLVLNSGGVFRNSSGAASGVAVSIADSIRVNNGGRYIHNTAAAHSANVQVLSALAGTESGVFELDIPAASSTISFSGRTFGTLSLRSSAAGGTCNYTAAGTSRVRIRSNLEIGSGVNFNLNFADTIFVLGNFQQDGGTFNVGNAPRSVAVCVYQNFTQAPGASITETGTGTQSIVMAGSGVQLLSVRGSWLNQVALVKTGTGSVLLKAPLSLPYKFTLLAGRIVTSEDWLLTLQPACVLETDSLSLSGFVTGPIRKESLVNSSFLFPVGGITAKRWLRLEQATGTFTVEYFHDDPTSLSSAVGTGLHHISQVEYWDVTSVSGSSAIVKLSFIDPHSGGVTDLSSLRVARLNNGIWQNAGNTNYSGSPGSNGWVSSSAAGGFSANTRSFALASAIGQENPLPLSSLKLEVAQKESAWIFKWELDPDIGDAEGFELQYSSDGRNFSTLRHISASKGQRKYEVFVHHDSDIRFCRVRLKRQGSVAWLESDVVKVNVTDRINAIVITQDNNGSTVNVRLRTNLGGTAQIKIYDIRGVQVAQKHTGVQAGVLTVMAIDLSHVSSGVYVVHVTCAGGHAASARLVKW